MSTRQDIDLVISKLMEADFDGLSKINSTSRTADLFITNAQKRKCAVKVFKDWREAGMNARQLFELERFAMKALAPTGRVPELVYDAIAQPDGPGGQRASGFMVVKPYYETFLDRVIESSSPLKLLEHAAQEVDISKKLHDRGWRDLDGSFTNDAFDDEGRLIRVDLDGAKPSGSLINRKFEEKYQTADDTAAIHRWLTLYDSVFSETSEVSSLAVRISRLLLHNQEDNWQELLDVASLRGKTSGGLPPGKTGGSPSIISRLKTGFAGLGRSVPQPAAGGGNADSPIEGKERQEPLTTETAALQAWTLAWKRTSKEDDDWTDGSLTRAEARLLALLTFHILSREDHGFTISDLYLSVMLMALAGIAHRISQITDGKADLTPHERDQFNKLLLETLYEVRTFLQPHVPPEVNDVEVEVTPLPPEDELWASEVICQGGAWAATRKGPDWKCQDIVMCPKGGSPLFILADGATKAGGAEAIKAAQETVESWPHKQHKTLGEARKNLYNLVQAIHQNVINLHRKAKKRSQKFQTTLVAATIHNAPPAPVLLLVRYGNSGFLVTHQPGGEDVVPIDGTINDVSHPLPIGVHGNTAVNSIEEIKEIRLNGPGVWRVRAYSDGVGSEEEAWAAMGGSKDIKQIVQEAATWSPEFARVGHDDWSVVGFDIKVAVKPPISSHYKAESAVLKRKTTFPWAGLTRLSALDFPFSTEAERFWKRALSTDYQLAEVANYPLIKKVIGVPPTEADRRYEPVLSRPPRQSPRMQEVATPFVQKGISSSKSFPYAYWAVALFVAAGVVYVMFLRGESQPPSSTSDGTASPPAAYPSPSPTPRLTEQDQAVLYSALRQDDRYVLEKSGNRFVLSGLPSGKTAAVEPLGSFLLKLAAALKRYPQVRVHIRVHTDTQGEGKTNDDIAKARGDAIVGWLTKQAKIQGDRVTLEAVGEKEPKISDDVTEQTKKLNRRIEVEFLPVAPS
jgi:outer membrane protein OmpA-like peptidoglycan-associated protein